MSVTGRLFNMRQVYVCKSGLYLPCLRSFLLLAQFWHTWEKMHESSKIFVEHVQPVALVQLPTRPTSCALETAGSVMSIALSKNGYRHWKNQFHKRRQDWLVLKSSLKQLQWLDVIQAEYSYFPSLIKMKTKGASASRVVCINLLII